MRLTVLASSSSGNCCLVRSGGDSVLIDAGISAKRIRDGLGEAGLTPAELTGILITHEHSDHIQGLTVLLKSTAAPVYAPGVLAAALARLAPGAAGRLRVLPMEEATALGSLSVLPFPTPHDVNQSVGYRIEAEGAVFALATDTGCITEEMLRALSGADIALIEANHDEQLLRYGPYPVPLKRRILSDRGHLSNAECTWLASVLAQRGTGQIVLGHLSRQNNDPRLAFRTVSRGVEATAARLYVAPELGLLELETETDPCCV